MRPFTLFVWFSVSVVSALQPHVLFVVVDDLGFNDVSFSNNGTYADYHTPFIDSLAHSGVILNNYYVTPLCSPSRSALMTGRYPYHTGLANNVITNGFPMAIYLNETLLPQKFKEAGYATHMFGKWDCGMTTWEHTPTYRGFDTFFGFYGAFEDHFMHTFESYETTPQVLGFDLRNGTEPIANIGQFSTHMYTDAVLSLIEGYDSSSSSTSSSSSRSQTAQPQPQPTAPPLFIYLAYQSIHTPLDVPLRYFDMCQGVGDFNRQVVCGMMQAVDESLAAVVGALKSKGMLDNTLIVFTTDNGGAVGSGGNNWPLRGGKGTNWEGGMRGVGFVSGAGVNTRIGISHELMHITDWFATLGAIAQFELNGTQPLDGRDMSTSFMSTSFMRDSGMALHQRLDGANATEAQRAERAERAERAKTGVQSHRPANEILLQLDPDLVIDGLPAAAIRVDEYKLVMGNPNCSLPNPNVTYLICPNGWTPPPPATPIPAPPNPASFVWLFNLAHDPLEKTNLATSRPDLVQKLTARIYYYMSQNVVQQDVEYDPAADPGHFGGWWTPWMSLNGSALAAATGDVNHTPGARNPDNANGYDARTEAV